MINEINEIDISKYQFEYIINNFNFSSKISKFLIILIITFYFIEEIKQKENYFINLNNNYDLNNEYIEKNQITVNNIKEKIKQINFKEKRKSKNLNNINKSNIENKNKIEEYINNSRNLDINDKLIKKFKINIHPKISIITTVLNGQKYIQYHHKSIQDQEFKNIEIIYIDDFSSDKSIQILENYQKKDKRIVLLKNKKNRGLFHSRIKGALFARGEYIQFLDIDDMLVGNILSESYKIAKFSNIDLVQHLMIIENQTGNFSIFDQRTSNYTLFQPELSDQMFYGNGYLKHVNYYITNKLIKTKIFLKSIINLGNDVINENINYHEDTLLLFPLLRVANSLTFLDHIGYAYLQVKNKTSLMEKHYKNDYINDVLHDIFIGVKMVFYLTNNSMHDKACCLSYFRLVPKSQRLMNHITRGYELFDEVYDLLINSSFYKEEDKINLKNFQKRMMINRFNRTNIKIS